MSDQPATTNPNVVRDDERDTRDVRDDRRDIRDVRDDGGDTRDGRDRTVDASENESDGFLPEGRMEEYRARWADVQTAFVDDPRTAVTTAHGLVTELVNDLTDTFGRERSGLESSWNRSEQPDTETLRTTLQRYRAFFNRLLGST